jgi:hypothetical protein
MTGLSEADLMALRWFREREPVVSLDVLGDRPPFKIYPTTRTREWLTNIGMLQVDKTGVFAWSTTEAGRAALDAALPNGESK